MYGVPKTEKERAETHAATFGGLPPPFRLGLGPKSNNPGNNEGLVPEDLLPDPEMFPLPVPKAISKLFKK